ncbi:MAG TPA: ABC transporter permease [Acidobacteriaceae bacterium]|nr:ABC transporter permease [Acidobacteriaceae bacterium]
MGWLRQLFSRRRRYDDLSQSIREHLEEKIDDLMDHGMTRDQAELAARREFGNITRIEERSREVWQWPTLESLWADAKYALRRLRKSPAFTSIALLTLALGIGVNTGIFTLLDAVLLKSLPVPDPEQLFIVKQSDHAAEKSRFPYLLFDHVSRQLPDTASMAAMSWPDDFYVRTGSGQPQSTQGQLVSGNYFQVFETYPVLGRLLTPADDEKLGGSPVAVISHGYWQRQFGNDPAVIGRKLEVNHVPVTIVGVAPQGFFGARAGTQPAFWLPLTMQSDVQYHDHYSDFGGAEPLKPWIPQANINWLLLVVRVKSPAAVPQLMTVLNQQYKSHLESLTQYLGDPDRLQAMLRIHLSLEPGQRGFANLRQQFEQPLLLLMAMAAIVLLIVCANIANLLLARAAARQHALAVQLSIGASRTRLIQQMLAECLLLSVGGGVLGIAVAYWCARVLPRWASTGTAVIPLNLAPDARILAFSVIIAVATGVLSGLVPALQSASVDPASVLKAGALSIPGGKWASRWSARKMLVVAQVALSLLLLVGAGMFLKTLENYSRLNPGFDRDHLLNVQIDTHLVNYQTGDFPSLYQRLADRMEAIPGVRSASITSCSLVAGCFDSSDVTVSNGSGRRITRANAQINSVSLNYFATTGIQLLGGREFVTTDDASSPRVAIVNQTFARRYTGASNPIGLEFSYADNDPNRHQIVGVVSDARVNDIREAAPPIIYFPILQNVGNIDGLEVRTAADPHWVAAQARQAIADVDPRIPIVNVATLNEAVKDNLTQPRLIARLTTIFGILALALACLGLYGVMSYTMQRRTSEVGVRLALGSTRPAVLWLVIRETLLLAGFGAVMGLALAIVGMHVATSFLFGLSPEDPAIIALATGLLLLASAVAGFVPAWRAAHIEPVQALRIE